MNHKEKGVNMAVKLAHWLTTGQSSNYTDWVTNEGERVVKKLVHLYISSTKSTKKLLWCYSVILQQEKDCIFSISLSNGELELSAFYFSEKLKNCWL